MGNRLGNYCAGSNDGFKAYMAKVDAAVENRCGLSVMDLPDVDFASMYEDGVSQAKAAARAIREAGG